MGRDGGARVSVRAQMARSGALALKDSKVSRGSCFLGGAGTGGWTRISPVPLRCARICGLLWLGGVGLSEMRSHLRVAGCGMAWSGAGTGRCGRISSALRRYVFVCGFLSLHLSGIPDLRAYLRVAVCGGLCRWYGSRRLDAYLAGAVEMRAYSRVAAVGRRRLAGDAFPSSGCRAWSGAGTGRCVRISSALRRYAPICRFLRLRPFGIPDLRVYLRDPVLSALSPALAKRPLPGHRPWHRANPNTRHHTSPVA